MRRVDPWLVRGAAVECLANEYWFNYAVRVSKEADLRPATGGLIRL